MKIYHDSCALIWAYRQGKIGELAGHTRTHALAEIFSSLTGKGLVLINAQGEEKPVKISPRSAAKIVGQIKARLEFVDLTAEEICAALTEAQKRGVQGGRVHDYLHAKAAEKIGAHELWTTDGNDFEGLGSVPLKQLAS